MKIAVIGAGYVGLSNALFFSGHNRVSVYDIDKEKIYKLANGELYISEKNLKDRLNEVKWNISFTEIFDHAVRDAEYVLIAVPTDLKCDKKLDVTMVKETINKVVECNKNAKIIIKSTVFIGFTEYIRKKTDSNNIFCCPEFLREGTSYYDLTHPKRLVIGGDEKDMREYVSLIKKELSINDSVQIIYCTSKEAETIKLYSNTYLAMRVAFFNELDSYLEDNSMNSDVVIKAICADERIGQYYNNPSFGYGGYCLPKDVHQLAAQTKGDIVLSIDNANNERKNHIVKRIIDMNVNLIGVYGIQMKCNSDNARNAAIIDVINELVCLGKQVYVYNPNCEYNFKNDVICVESVDVLYEKCEIILANRVSKELERYIDKVYTRDLYCRD